jgi:hypothetical protein
MERMTEYPSEEALAAIAQWPHNCFLDLMDAVKDIWAYADWGWRVEHHVTRDVFYLSTAGWSGNESIISALQDNRMFWAMCWQESRRGGHYVFHVRHETTQI